MPRHRPKVSWNFQETFGRANVTSPRWVEVTRAGSRSPDLDPWPDRRSPLKLQGDLRSGGRRGQETRAERVGRADGGVRRPAPSAGSSREAFRLDNSSGPDSVTWITDAVAITNFVSAQ